MSEDRTKFQPKVGETYLLREDGTGEVLRDDLTGDSGNLAVLVSKFGKLFVVTMKRDGKYCIFQNHRFDLMPPIPEKKYRQWTREEFMEFAKRDGWVQHNGVNSCMRVTGITENNMVRIDGTYYSLKDLLTNFHQNDEAKTPCGVEV